MSTLNHKSHILAAFIATTALSLSLSHAANAQSTSLRDPLDAGANASAPFIPATGNPAESPGMGPVPLGVVPGMPLPSTFEPWIPAIPFNTAGQSSSGISLPYGAPISLPPGVLGPALTGIVPSSPSAQGNALPYLRAPVGSIVPSEFTNVNAGGGNLPGTGGYYGSIPHLRRGGQTTAQFEERGLYSTFGGGGNSQDEVTETGPLSGFGVPYGIPTGNGYNNGVAGTNNDLRLSAIDLGGGQRMRVGGTTISTGSSVQNYPGSVLRNNPISALNGHQSTDFGQGIRNAGVGAQDTTDFGFSFRQSNPANIEYQKTGQLLLPTAVETNY